MVLIANYEMWPELTTASHLHQGKLMFRLVKSGIKQRPAALINGKNLDN